MRKKGLHCFPKQNKTEDLVYLALENTIVSEALGRNEFEWLKKSCTLWGQVRCSELDLS